MSDAVRRRMPVVLAVVVACLAGAAPGLYGQDNPYERIREHEFGAADEAFRAIEKQVQRASPDDYPDIEEKLIAVVEDPQASSSGKQFACRMLRIAGSEKCISAVSDLLTDERLSHAARWVLQKMESEKADRVLRQALADASGETRIGLMETIGERGDPKALDQLVELAGAEDQATARAALGAIGKIGTADAAAALDGMDVPDGLQMAWCDASLSCAEKLAAAGHEDRAEEVCRKLLEGDYRALVRAAAFGKLAELQQAEAVPLVIDTLDADERELRQAAAQAVLDIEGAEASRRFADELPDLAPDTQALLLGLLAERGEATGLTDVVNDLADSNSTQVRTAAIQALVPLGDAGSVEVVARTLADGGESAGAARETLLNIQGEGVKDALVDLVEDGPAEVRATVIKVLAERGMSDAVPALWSAAEDDSDRVRRAAIMAIGELGSPEEVPRLVEFMLNPVKDGDRGALQSAVTKIGGRADEPSSVTEPIVDALDEADTDARTAMLTALGRVNGEQALEAVRSYADSSNSEVQKAAVRALGMWPNPAPLSDLRRLAEDAGDRTARILAFRGFVGMIENADRSPGEKLELYGQAMELAPRVQEKRTVLGALGGMAHEGALEMAEEYLDDAQLGAEAMQAYSSIAANLGGKNPDVARTALERVVNEADSDRVKENAREALRKLERYEGRIGTWMLAGPYAQDDAGAQELFDIAFAPEQEGQEADWKQISANSDGVVHLDSLLGGNERVAYLRATIVSPEEQDARLEIGSDDGFRAWLNGEVVAETNTTRAFSMPQDQADIHLQEGENSILLKITQGGGQWAACARIVGRDGRPLDGLTFRAK